MLSEADLAIGRLDPFDPDSVPVFPVFKNPFSLRPGTSLCRLGFPFHEIAATFDEARQRFALAPDALPIPRFPIEGIFTREQIGVHLNGINVKFVETSSPGLGGQSGGPIFDVNGTGLGHSESDGPSCVGLQS